MTPITLRGSDDPSTTPADSIATSVPAPIAIPTSARASAGASFTPSPTIATFNPRAWSSATACVLVLGEHFGEHLVDRQLLPDAVGDLLRVARDHHHLDATRVQIAHRRVRLGPDLVLERERADHGVGVHDVEHRRPAALPRGDLRRPVRRAPSSPARGGAQARPPRRPRRRPSLRRRGRRATGSRSRPEACLGLPQPRRLRAPAGARCRPRPRQRWRGARSRPQLPSPGPPRCRSPRAGRS